MKAGNRARNRYKMKKNEIRSMSAEEKNERELELKKELIKLNAQIATGTAIKNSGHVGSIKKTLSKIKTMRKEAATKKAGEENK